MTIWKYKLDPGRSKIDIPEGGKVLCTQTQYGDVCIWVLVNPEARPTAREFMVYGTGHPIPEDPGTYVGTIQMSGGTLIFHVFEISGK